MFAKYLCTTVIAASLCAIPAEETQADEAAAFIGGALLGGLVVNEVHKNKQRKQQATRQSTSKSYSSGISSAQRQQNREVQTALNYFSYNVGGVDGVLGRNSRAAISRFQADMGYPADGYLNDNERAFLVNSYQRALASAHVPPYNQILASQGQAGLLRTYRNEQLGIVTPQTPQAAHSQGQLAYAQPQGQSATVPQLGGTTTPLATAPVSTQPQGQLAALPQVGGDQGSVQTTAARADTGGQLPAFAFAPTGTSAVKLCNDTSILTASNTETPEALAKSNPELALNQQFCQARIQSIAEANRLEEGVPNMTAPQIEQQCEQLTKAVSPYIQGISTETADSVIAVTSTFLQQSGQPMNQLISGGEICLGVGYRTDNGEMAMASAALLTAAGEQGYGELVSHQLREGIGATKATGAEASEWMQLALNAAESGNAIPGQTPERIAVLKAASGPGGSASTSSIPVFQTSTGD